VDWRAKERHLTPSPTERRSDPRQVAGSARRLGPSNARVLPSEVFSKPKGRKSKTKRKEIQRKGKRIPNIFVPPIETFQRVKPQFQEKSDILDVRPIINRVSKL
jgi:hypothetical protein